MENVSLLIGFVRLIDLLDMGNEKCVHHHAYTWIGLKLISRMTFF